MHDVPSFGRLLRRYRRSRDLTQAALARQAYCALTTVKKIESDERRPSRELAERIAGVLGVPQADAPAFLRVARGLYPDASPPALPLAPPLTTEELGREDVPGREVRGYALRERLGIGGFGAVYHAIQSSSQREVAIKIVLPRYANHPDFIRRFESAAQIIARLEHPSIVPLYDYWREPNSACLVMRYMRGGSLADVLRDGPLAPDDVLRVLEQVGAALAAAHQANVVHRAITPANVLRDGDGTAFLSDFGIAKALDGHPADGAAYAGALVGSLAYLSPEQITDEPVTPRTDIYSLGVMTYELFTGVKPFAAHTPTELLRLHLTTPLPELRIHCPELPEALDAIIRRATAKNPAQRYAQVTELTAAVRAVLAMPAAGVIGRANGHVQRTPPDGDRLNPELDGRALPNPYKGLRAFGEADAGDFFGRDALLSRLLERLAEEVDGARFLAVVGPSGSGKSSVVRAGLIPALRQGGLPGSERWFIAEMIPGTHPHEELELALRTVATQAPPDLAEQLRRDSRGLLRAARLILPEVEGELVLVIDQFEELFTLLDSEDTRVQFLDSLVAAATDPRSRVRVIITLRADFYDRPLRYGSFGALIRERTEVILPLDPDELEAVIVGPAARAGVRVEPELTAEVLRDIASQPGALPLLQYALFELFEQRDGRGEVVSPVLTRAAYRASGGVRGALTHRAEAGYTALGAAEQSAARQLFLRLVAPGEGADDARRRARLAELSDTAAGVARTFAAARLLTFDREPVTRQPTVEVAHEALLRAWPRLKGWIEGARADLRVQHRLALEAAEWKRAGGDVTFLARGALLAQYEALVEGASIELTLEERGFVSASRAEREQQAAAERERQARELAQARALATEQRQRAEEQTAASRRLRRRAALLAGALGLAVLAALSAGYFAQSNGTLATQNAAVAQTAAAAQEVAEVNFANGERLRLAAQANNVLSGDQPGDLAALLALRSLRLGYSGDADAALQLALAKLPRRRLIGHAATVEAVAYSPDGHSVLSGGDDGTIRLWDAASGHELRRLMGHDGRVLDVAYSPDGRSVLSTGDDGTVRLWDVGSGKELRRLAEHAGIINSVAYSPDGAYALTGNDFSDQTGEPGVARLFDLASGTELRQLRGHTGAVTQVAFAPDGKTALTASHDFSVRLWEVASGRELRQFLGHSDEVYGVAFSPDGQAILSGSNDRTVRMWDVATGRETQRFNGHTHVPLSVAFGPAGDTVLSGSWDNTVRLWSVANGREIKRFTGHTQQVNAVAFSPDGTQFVSGGFDQDVLVWDTYPQLEPRTLLGHTNIVTSVAFSPDGTQIVSSGRGSIVRLWNTATGHELKQFPADDFVPAAMFSPDGTQIVTTSFFDHGARLWDAASGQELRRFASVWDAAFSPDGALLLTSSLQDNQVRLWDGTSGREIRRFAGHTAPVTMVVFSSDGARMLTSSDDRTARLWDVASGTELRQFISPLESAPFFPRALDLSPDGRMAVTAAGRIVQLWDTATGSEIRRLVGHTGEVDTTVFSPDGRYVLTGGDDYFARLWEASSGREVRRFAGHSLGVFTAAFSPDGATIVTGGFDATVRIWRVDGQDVVGLACAQLTRDLTDDERREYVIADGSPSCPPRE